jgi:hypothetical protein
MPETNALLIIGLAWALAFPVIMMLAAAISPRPRATAVDPDPVAVDRLRNK